MFDAETGVLHAAPLLHRTADPRLRRPTRGDVGAARRAGAAGDDEHDDRGRRHGLRSVAEAHRLAGAAHDGLARAVRPRTSSPGTRSSASPPAPERPAAVSSAEDVRQLNLLYAAAADVVARAIARGVLAARATATALLPGPFPSSTPSRHV